MAHLSIRKLPPELNQAIVREARRRGATKTAIVIEALKKVFHLESAPVRIQRDVRKFFGKMNLKDYQEFQELTRDFSKIDKEIWK